MAKHLLHLRFLALALFLTSGAGSALAATFQVAPDGTGDFPTLEAAFAAVSAPDTVVALAGEHVEGPLNLPLGVTLLGETGQAGDVILNILGGGISAAAGVEQMSALTVRASGDGLRISIGDSFVSNCVFEFCGGWGVRSDTATSRATLVDCTVRNNVRGLSGQLDLLRCSVVDNGRGILASGTSSITDSELARGSSHVDAAGADSLFVQGSSFVAGAATIGGALSLPAQGFARVLDSHFEDNYALSWGGAISGVGTTVEIENCDFLGNRSHPVFGAAGAVALYSAPAGQQALVRDCRFEGNEAAAAGAVLIRYATGMARLEDCSFLNDTAAAGGAALEIRDTGSVVVSGCRIEGATSGPEGAAIVSSASLVEIEDSIVWSGAATSPLALRQSPGASVVRRTLLGGIDQSFAWDPELVDVQFDCSLWYPSSPFDAGARALAAAPGLKFFEAAYCGADSVPTNSFAAGRDGCPEIAGAAATCAADGIYVQSVPPGLSLRVDGADVLGGSYVPFTAGAALLLEANAVSSPDGGTQFVFESWSDGGAASHTAFPANFDEVPTATFSVEYRLTTSVIGGGMVTPASGFYGAGDLTIEAVADSGWQFIRWQGDVEEVENPLQLDWSGPLAVEAVFAPSSGAWLASFDVEPSGPSAFVDGVLRALPHTVFWEFGTLHTVEAEPQWTEAEGTRLVFDSWESGRPRVASILVGGEVTDTAHYEREHLVSFLPAVNGQVPPDQFVPEGLSVNILASPAEGWLFDQWIGTGDGSYSGRDNPAVVSALEPIEQQALFVPDTTVATLRIDALPAGFEVKVNGSIESTPYEGAWPRNEVVTIEGIAPAAWAFVEWRGDGEGSYDGPDNPTTVTMLGTVEQTAEFELDPTLTRVRFESDPPGYPVELNGTIVPTPYEELRPRGELLQVSAAPGLVEVDGERAQFNRWASGFTADYNLTLSSEVFTDTLFVDPEYQLTMRSRPLPSVLTPGSGWYAPGTEVEIEVVPAGDATFARWVGIGDGSYSGTENPVTVTLNGPIDQEARVSSTTGNGYDVRLSASDTDPTVQESEPTNGLREIHLWVTCARRGLSALEASVTGSLQVLGFNPAPNVLNAGNATDLLLAVGGCPGGETITLRLGSWIVWDDGGTLCLERTTESMASFVDCDPVNPFVTQDPGLRGYSSVGSPCRYRFTRATCFKRDRGPGAANIRVVAQGGEVHLSWDATDDIDVGGFRIERSEETEGPWRALVGAEGGLLAGQSSYDYTDDVVRPNHTYFYEIVAVSEQGSEKRYGPYEAQVRPSETAFSPPRPNPFTGQADFAFSLAIPGPVTIEIFDVTGRLVRRLVDGVRPAGEHVAVWDGRDGSGQVVPAGVYFSRFEAGGVQQSRKIVRTGTR